MADINFGILDTQMPGRIAAIPQQQQAQQAQNAMQLMQVQQTMQQNALAKAKMEEYTRGTAEKNALRGRMTQPGFNIYDPAHQADIMALSPDLAPGLIKHALDVKTAESTTNKNLAQTRVAQEGITKAKRDFGNEARRSLAFNPSDANIQAWNEDAVKRGFITQQEADLEVKDMLRVPLDQRKTVFERAGASAAAPQQPRQTNMATDLLIPGPNGTMVPNQQLIDVRGRLAGAGAARTINNINAFAPASEEAQKELIKSTRATYDTLKQAPATLKNIEEAKKLVPAAATFMGAGGEGLKEAASFLNNRLGMNIDTKGVVAASELQSRLFQGILDNLKKLDAQPSQSQQAALQTALGSLNTDPNALPRVLDSFADTIRAKVDLHNAEVTGAESKGVKFPYNPIINLPAKTSGGSTETWVRDAKGTLVRKQ